MLQKATAKCSLLYALAFFILQKWRKVHEIYLPAVANLDEGTLVEVGLDGVLVHLLSGTAG
jgi:hypothetical protein